MAIPPKGDPKRPLALAANAARVFGTFQLILCALAGYAMTRVTRGRADTWIITLRMGIVALGLVVPGVLYLVCAAALMRYRSWAGTTIIVVAALQCILFMVNAVANLMLPPQPNLIVGGYNVALAVIGGLLIYHALQALAAIRLHRAGEGRAYGFEPVMPTAAAPGGGASTDAPRR